MQSYTTVQHPKSGDTYAVERDPHGKIIAVAGPMDDSEGTLEEIIGYLSNATTEDREDDAEWLRHELGEWELPR